LKHDVLNLRFRTRLGLIMCLIMGCISAILTATYVYHSNLIKAYVEAQTSELVAISNLAQERIRPGADRNAALAEYKKALEDAGLKSITVASPTGEVVASTNPSQVGKTIKIKKRQVASKQDPIKISAEFRDIDVDTAVEQKTLVVDFPIIQGDKVIGYAQVRGEGDKVGDLLRHYYQERLAWILVTLLAGMFAVVYLATRFTRPVDLLVRGAQQVAHGNLEVWLPGTDRDEMGRLAHTFNQMVERLREHRELQARLNQAEKLSLLGRFAATVAHEVRNSLNFINLSIDQIRAKHGSSDDLAAQELQRSLRNIKDEVSRMNRLVNDFLAAGRQSPPELAECDVRVTVGEAVALAEKQASRQGVSIRIELPSDLPILHADSAQLKTCFINLLTNAIQAMPEGGEVRISARVEPSEQIGAGRPGLLTLRFADTGHGIPAEDRERVFAPYYSTRTTGFGLGLAITRKIVEDHGGRIYAADGEGSGVVMVVELPVPALRQVPTAVHAKSSVA
jgi:nitrogen fixation/metabolism regulation signal transduction histidine kinase